MGLDTRYRPTRYEDVIGQESTVKVLQQFVRTGTGFHQSYVFCGPFGSGKTTLARILARSLLCESPVDGGPCDACTSCTSILEVGASECFVEFDAATNSGKDDVRKIVEQIQYSTFSGKRRIYLLDEAHQLSKQALDGFLKSMEDTVPGSDDKLLVCIFCTTEPEKMRATIFSRCAPAFVIRPVTPEKIGDRLVTICDKERIDYDREALDLIAEVVECHIRDALKAVEGVSMLGPVNRENVASYLRLDSAAACLKILQNLGGDLPAALSEAERLTTFISPSACYERLSDAASVAYKTSLGVGKAPTFWDVEIVKKVGEVHGDFLITFASHLAARPGRPTVPMLLCDLSYLHRVRLSGTAAGTVLMPRQALAAPPVMTSHTPDVSSVLGRMEPVQNVARISPEVTPHSGKVEITAPRRTGDGAYVDPRATKKVVASTPVNRGRLAPLDPYIFKEYLHRRVLELIGDERDGGQTRWPNLGGH